MDTMRFFRRGKAQILIQKLPIILFAAMLAAPAPARSEDRPSIGKSRAKHGSSRARVDLEAGIGYKGFGYFVLLGHGWNHGPSGQITSTVHWMKDENVSRGLRLTLNYTQLLDGYSQTCSLGCDALELDHGFNIAGSIGYFRLVGRQWYSIGLGIVLGVTEDNHVLGDGEKPDGTYVRPELALGTGYRIPIGSDLFVEVSLDVGTLLVAWGGIFRVGLGYSL